MKIETLPESLQRECQLTQEFDSFNLDVFEQMTFNSFFDLYRSQKTKVLYFVNTQVIRGSGESFRQTDRQT